MAEAQLDLDISPALSAIDELSTVFDDIVTGFGASLGDALSGAVAGASDIGSTLDDVSTNFSANISDALTNGVASAGDIGVTLDDVGANFGTSITDALASGVAAADDIGTVLDEAANNFGDALGGSSSSGGGAAGQTASSVSNQFQQLGTTLQGTAAEMSLAENASRGLEGATGVLEGRVGGLLTTVAPEAAIFAGVTAAVVGLVNEGANAEQAIAQMNRVFGDEAPGVFSKKVDSVGLSLSEMDLKTGASDTKMRGVLSTFGQTAIGAGETATGAAEAARQMGTLATILTTLKPALGSADENFQMITRGLGGSVRILQRYGITIDAAQQSHLALAIAQEHGRTTASLYDKQMAGLQLTMQALNKQATDSGTTLKAELDKGFDSPIVKLRALKGEIQTTLEDIAVPLVAAGVKIATELEPIVVQIIKIFGDVAKSVLDVAVPVVSVLVDVLGPALKEVGKVVQELGPEIGVVVTAFAGFKILSGITGIVTGLGAALGGLFKGGGAAGPIDEVGKELAKTGTSASDVLPKILSLGSGLASFAVQAALPVGAILAVGYALHTVFGDDNFGKIPSQIKNAQQAGAQWAQSEIAASKEVGGSKQDLVNRIKEEEDSLKNLHTRYDEGKISVENAIVAAGKYKGEISALKASIKATDDQQKLAVQTNKEISKTLGVEVPQASLLASGALKAIDKELPALTQHYGEFGAAVIVGSGVQGDAMKNLMKDTDNFNKTITAAVDSATDVFTHFKGKTSIAEADMEQFFVGSHLKAAGWAAGLTQLISEGVDSSFVNQLAKLGPDSQPQLDAFQAMVEQHGAAWVNSVGHSADAAVKATEDAYTNMEVKAAMHAGKLTEVITAGLADAREGGHRHLLALKSDTDQELNGMVYAALLAIPQMVTQFNGLGSAVNAVPTSHNTVFTANADDLLGTVKAAGDAIRTVAGQAQADLQASTFGPWGKPKGAATGGIFNTPEVRLFAEAGPEAVLPLSDPKRSWDLINQSGLMRTLSDNTSAVARVASAGVAAPASTTHQVIHQDNSVNIHGVPDAHSAVDEFSWAQKTNGR